MRFSTTRFFTDQFLRSYRMSRLREIFLLLCRMALFALLAIAIAQPLLKWNAPVSQLSKDARTVVLVVDNSASMNYTENDATLLDKARTAARSVVDHMRIIEALECRHAELAERLAREHTLGLAAHVEEHGDFLDMTREDP